MAKVRIAGTDHALDAAEGDDLLRVLQAANFPIATSCGGRASCGLCRVAVTEGMDALSPIVPEEIVHLGNVAKVIGTRLACQARICGQHEVVVVVPTVEDVEARKRQKAERLQRERAAQRARTDAGEGRVSMPPSSRGSTPRPPVAVASPRIEWRPRKLETKPNGGQ